MGAVDARNTGMPGSERTYDFGPGGGLVAAASLHVGGTPVLSARWHWAYLHSVSGSPADHYTQFAGVEAMLPVTTRLRAGGVRRLVPAAQRLPGPARRWRHASPSCGSSSRGNPTACRLWRRAREAAHARSRAPRAARPSSPGCSAARVRARRPRRSGRATASGWTPAPGTGGCASGAPTAPSTGTAYGGTVTVTLGRSVSRTVVLGLEGQVWTSWEAGPRELVRSLTVVAQWYPDPGRRFFVRGRHGDRPGTGAARRHRRRARIGEGDRRRPHARLGLRHPAGRALRPGGCRRRATSPRWAISPSPATSSWTTPSPT